ncbi:DNA gyrase subunit A [Hahella sp. KA22]|uniref:DNA gyrase subunit A n=1 Tax=Hahella sp. KA22 TaxID=1628392 RepID=UPI000FDEA129|nr:DNA gyrase subunit A [Hahella sp. KA22]AZZ91139.1 DNA gyrase subunit A [Hahella sp. KA22]QAY54507.1 DNA gyrase subunit A [Hahella sp. KA22]
MAELAKEILPVNIEDELKQSYLDYAMSVIVGRALPDARDGLKPVHRRVLFAMNELGNDWNKAYKKSARVVGDVIGKYHPHGDSAVYDTIVRMAQPFSLRYTLVDGQGNFGSIDGDSAAAMRYTEIRMEKIAHEMLADLDKETVDFAPNYDGSEQIPVVLPTKVPNLLVNGSSGIAVGMATNIPPHNLTEVVNGCLAYLDDSDITIDELMEFIPGPDFPTAAIINGRAGILEAYRTGRGRIYIRARYEIEQDKKTSKETIVITEIPYQVNKAKLVEKIAELVKEKKVEGITELRDESSKEGMRVVIELRRGENADVLMNNLFALTPLETVFGINMVALINGEPKLLNLKDCIECFVRHRREVVTRRTIYELRKARERGHILEGQAVALANIDPVIAVIKASSTGAEAKERLMAQGWSPGAVTGMLERAGEDACRPDDLAPEFGLRDGMYYLSEVQAQSILDLRLQKLTGLEIEKINDEYRSIIEQIAELLEILQNPERLMEVIREELEAVREEFGDARVTEITASKRDLTIADLIAEEDMVVTLSHKGYAKTQPLEAYQAQKRGGKGKAATAIRDEDFVEKLLIANSHDTILCFTSHGKLYWLKTYEIPQASRISRGRPIVNILPLAEDERITTMLPVREYAADHYVFMATRQGTVKKTPLENFSRPRSNGLIALALDEGDMLIGAAITDGKKDVMLFSSSGKAIRFNEDDVRPMGRTARGVRGIRIAEGQTVVSLIIPQEDAYILTASRKGYGKRTDVSEFPVYGRGGQGVIAIQCSERNGDLVSAVQVISGDQLMLISNQGTLVRTRSDEVSIVGRNTQGVRLIRLSESEDLVGVERIAEPEEDESDFQGEEGEGAEVIDGDELDSGESGEEGSEAEE